MAVLKCFSAFSKEFKELYSTIKSEILNLEGISEEQLDPSSMANKYFNEKVVDFSVDDNSNHLQDGKSHGNYISEVGKSHLKLIGYNDLYDLLFEEYGRDRADKILKAVWQGDLYFHDSTAIQVPYCWAYSTEFILRRGSYWGQLHSLPANRARSYIDQVKEVTIEIAQEIAGAVAIGDLFVNYSYFLQKDNLDINDEKVRKEVENDFQSLVHTLNKKLRPSHQSPFTNISIFDKPNLKILFEDVVFPDGSKPNVDLIWEIQKIFTNWFHKGDPVSNLPYRFPVVTLNLRTDENGKALDQDALDYYSKVNLDKAGFNIYISSGNKIASCCRLTNDLDLAGVDSFGNGGISLGSHRVVTINLARLGKIANSYEELIPLLNEQLDMAKDSLESHRKLLKKRHAEGFLPFVKRGIIHLDRLFSTFGISGVYECIEQLGFFVTTESGKNMAYDLLAHIKSYATQAAKSTGNSFNIEQVPAESLAVKFALKDQLLYGMDYPIYSNQFIPLWVDYDIVDRVKLDGAFSKVLTGGGISHLNVGEKLTSPEQMKKLIAYAIQSGCEHFAVNYNYCQCENDHVTISGQVDTCPICTAPIKEQYTRVIGYLTPVSAWNKGRRVEHKTRVFKDNNIKDNVAVSNTETCDTKEVQV
jgi:ribonucleoside-triphosphate reductase (formate)